MNKELNFRMMPSGYGKASKEVRDYITNLQHEIEQYENPDDMTLFYMWLDAKAKDKMKELKQENERLNSQLDFIDEQNKYIDRLEKIIKDYTSRCEKAIEYIKEMLYPIGSCVNGSDLPYESIESLLNILQNGSENK